jgi:hypothetical protein
MGLTPSGRTKGPRNGAGGATDDAADEPDDAPGAAGDADSATDDATGATDDADGAPGDPGDWAEPDPQTIINNPMVNSARLIFFPIICPKK